MSLASGKAGGSPQLVLPAQGGFSNLGALIEGKPFLQPAYISQLSTLSAVNVADGVRSLDEAFAAYATSIVDNSVDGDVVISFIKDQVLYAMFRELGITNQEHRKRLTLHFTLLYMQEAPSQQHRTTREAKPSECGLADLVGLNELTQIAATEQQQAGPDLMDALKKAGVQALGHRRKIEKQLRSKCDLDASAHKAAGERGVVADAAAALRAEREAQQQKKAAEEAAKEAHRKGAPSMSQNGPAIVLGSSAVGADVARCKAVMAADCEWIAFLPTEARWIPMSVDETIKTTYGTRPTEYKATDPGESNAEAWLNEAESCLTTWILTQIVESEKRAACFRALGRGWIFVQLSSSSSTRRNLDDLYSRYYNRTRFRWWFEGCDRVASTRKDEIAKMKFPTGLNSNHYLYGTVMAKEQVFVFKGLDPACSSMISLTKLRTDWKKLDVWVSNEEMRKTIEMPTMTDEERQLKVEKVQARKAKRRLARKARAKARKQEEAEAAPARRAKEEEAGREAAVTFETLLEELKLEDGLPIPAPLPVPLPTQSSQASEERISGAEPLAGGR
mmetsp:Transcript_67971/g.112995  ORF Transcript_67971/g.112995 Transcript_67971/m.112995 type:complete len:561 (-) Transcript_67971:230-1912(-)